MSEKDPQTEPLSPPVMLLDFSDRIAHLKTGYDNAQAVVRFLDTKAAAVIGIVPVVVGVLVAVFGLLQKVGDWDKVIALFGTWVPIAYGTAFLASVAMVLLFAWHTIAQAFDAILPRDVGTAAPSILFPFSAQKDSSNTSNDAFKERLMLFTETPSQADTIEDYKRQLSRMSEIVAIKLNHVNGAITNLKKMFFFSAISLAIMVLVTAVLVVLVATVK